MAQKARLPAPVIAAGAILLILLWAGTAYLSHAATQPPDLIAASRVGDLAKVRLALQRGDDPSLRWSDPLSPKEGWVMTS